MAFNQWLMPLFDSLFAILLQYCEVIKGRLVEKTTVSTINIAKLNKEVEETGLQSSSSAIGFVIPDEREEEYDDENI